MSITAAAATGGTSTAATGRRRSDRNKRRASGISLSILSGHLFLHLQFQCQAIRQLLQQVLDVCLLAGVNQIAFLNDAGRELGNVGIGAEGFE